MKVKEALKDLNLKINSILVEAYTEISEEIKNIKKIIDDEKSEEKIKLIEQICKGEGFNDKEIKNKYLSEKDKKKIKTIPETVEVINDELLDTVEIEDKTYYYEPKEKGNIYDSSKKVVGTYKNGKFTILN